MEKYTKPSLTYSQQVDLLKSRGLIIADQADAERFLKQINYYRFSAYCLAFETSRHKFKSNVTFEQVVRSYEFDRRLRFLVDEALDIIEISVRAITSYEMAQKHGAFFHEDKNNFFLSRRFDYVSWIEKVHQEADRSKENFIKHYKDSYEGFPKLPIWVAVEVMSFGSISILIDHLKQDDQLLLAKKFGVHTSFLMSWLHTFTYVRNICAHHSRLLDKKLAIPITLPKDDRWNDADPSRIGAVLLAINRFLYKLPVDPKIVQGWRSEIEGLFDNEIEIDDFWHRVGLKRKLKEHPLWVQL